MKPQDNAPITLTKMVGHFHFVDSCLFLVFFTRGNFKGPRRHKRKGTAGEWGLAYSTGGPGKGEQPCPGAASAPWVTERVQPTLPWASSQTDLSHTGHSCPYGPTLRYLPSSTHAVRDLLTFSIGYFERWQTGDLTCDIFPLSPSLYFEKDTFPPQLS